MPDFNKIIDRYIELGDFAGNVPGNKNKSTVAENKISEDKKRASLIDALDVRNEELSFRFKISVGIIIIALLTLLYFSIFQPQGLKGLKEFASILGGGSVIALLTYTISLRDELTKIKQTKIIAMAVDTTTLNTMLLTLLSAK